MAEEAQQEQQEAQQEQGEQAQGGEQQQAAPEAKLTQAEVDDILKRRLAAERKKWQAEADEAAKKATMTETERLKAEKEAAEKAVADAVAKANATIVRSEARVQALAAGAQLDAIDDVLKLVDLAGVEVGEDGTFDAKLVAAEIAGVKKRLPGLFGVADGKRPAQGAADFTASGEGKRVYSAREVEKMLRTEPQKWAEIKDDYLAALNEGRVRD